MTKKVLKIHENDNVFVVLQDLRKDEEVLYENESYQIRTDIPSKHKFASIDLQKDDVVIMYGVVVGKALDTILKGYPITTTNTIHNTGNSEITAGTYHGMAPNIDQWENRHFLGYHRQDGKVGVANYWLVVPLVFCENRNIELIKESMLNQLGYGDLQSQVLDIKPLIEAYQKGQSTDELKNIPISREGVIKKSKVFKNIAGIKFLTHQMGCGGTRADAKLLCELIAG